MEARHVPSRGDFGAKRCDSRRPRSVRGEVDALVWIRLEVIELIRICAAMHEFEIAPTQHHDRRARPFGGVLADDRPFTILTTVAQ